MTKCVWSGCRRPAAYRVTRTNDNGTRDRVHHHCDRPEHLFGSAVHPEPPKAGEPRVTPWRLMGLSGTHVHEALEGGGK